MSIPNQLAAKAEIPVFPTRLFASVHTVSASQQHFVKAASFPDWNGAILRHTAWPQWNAQPRWVAHVITSMSAFHRARSKSYTSCCPMVASATRPGPGLEQLRSLSVSSSTCRRNRAAPVWYFRLCARKHECLIAALSEKVSRHWRLQCPEGWGKPPVGVLQSKPLVDCDWGDDSVSRPSSNRVSYISILVSLFVSQPF